MNMQKTETQKSIPRQRGASLTGYGLIVGLIAIAAIAAVGNVGQQVTALFGGVAAQMEMASAGAVGGGGSGGVGNEESGEEEEEEEACADPVGEGVEPGTLCADGSFYIGAHDYGEGLEPLFATHCDLGTDSGESGGGQADGTRYDGSGCSGQWQMLIYGGYGTTVSGVPAVGTDYAAAKADFSGQESTDILAAVGGGSSDHEAALGCSNLATHGYDDWYLPSLGEQDIIWAATHINAQASDAGSLPWIPADQSSGTAFGQTFHDSIFSGQACNVTAGDDFDADGEPCRIWSTRNMGVFIPISVLYKVEV